MSRRFLFVVALASALFVPVNSVDARAGELRDGGSLLSGMVGWTNHESQQSGDRIDGASWSVDYARIGKGGRWSAGFVMRRFESDENFAVEGTTEETRVNAKRLVTAVQGSFYFSESRISPYVGVLLGVHMQTSDVYPADGDDFRQANQTLATGFSVGSYFHMTEGMFVRVDYTFSYFADSDTINNNHMHVLYGGLGFQFGGR
jgi:hypothetical protein